MNKAWLFLIIPLLTSCGDRDFHFQVEGKRYKVIVLKERIPLEDGRQAFPLAVVLDEKKNSE